MPFRDRFVSCVDCERSFVSFDVCGCEFQRCEGCEGAWVSHQTLQALFSNMRWDARVEMWQPHDYRAATGNAALQLSVWRGDDHLGVERFDRPVIKIGRLASCHLRLDDESVSRMHAVIEFDGPDAITIIDLASAAGTRVNFEMVDKASLADGDSIQIGIFRLDVAVALEASGDAPPSTRECPDCGNPLLPMHIERVEVDVCDAHGVWFDKRELQSVLYRIVEK